MSSTCRPVHSSIPISQMYPSFSVDNQSHTLLSSGTINGTLAWLAMDAMTPHYFVLEKREEEDNEPV